MKKIDDYKIDFTKVHAWECTEGTNNTIFYNAVTSQINDEKVVIPDEVREKLGLPENIKSYYDQKKYSGAYERLWDITVISLCSDVEYFLKGLFKILFPSNKFKFGFYQRFHDVVSYLKNNGINFSAIEYEIEKIFECFQIRHIATHNMGYVDESYKKRITTSLIVGEKLIVTQEMYENFYSAYMKFLGHIDEYLYERSLRIGSKTD